MPNFCPNCGHSLVRIETVATPPPVADAGPQTTLSSWVPAQPAGSTSATLKRRRWPFVGLVVLTVAVIVVYVALNAGGLGHPTPTATPEPVVSWVTVPGGSGDSAVGVGGSPAKMGSTCGFAAAGAGDIFLAVGVAYRAGADSLFFSPSEWTLHDETNAQYGQSLSAYGCFGDQSKLLGVGTLNPGLSTRGGVLFEIPANANHLSIDWRGTTSGQMLTWRLGW